MVGSILVEQGIGRFTKIPGRRVLGSWLLCCIIVCTVYKAKLTSVLINPPAEHLASLDDMADAGYVAYANEVLFIDILRLSNLFCCFYHTMEMV